MSGWNIRYQAKGKEAAKAQLNEFAGDLPDTVEETIRSLIDAMPDTDLEGYETLNVQSNGHFREGDPGTSDCTILVQFMADPPPPADGE